LFGKSNVESELISIVRNSIVSLSSTLVKNEKVERYIKINTNKLIVLRCWIESDVNILYD